MKKSCPHCDQEIIGRSDKIFCSDYCRSSTYNHRNNKRINKMREIQRKLHKNRRILNQFIKRGVFQTSRDALTANGFDFDYFTHIETTCNEKNRICFDMGYAFLNDNQVKMWKG